MIEMAITKSQEFRSGQDWANDVIVAANVLANEMERKYKDATTL